MKINLSVVQIQKICKFTINHKALSLLFACFAKKNNKQLMYHYSYLENC